MILRWRINLSPKNGKKKCAIIKMDIIKTAFSKWKVQPSNMSNVMAVTKKVIDDILILHFRF